MGEWNEFSTKKIVGVKQRIQTVVVYEEIDEGIQGEGQAVQKEAIVDSFDRPIQADYT